MAQTPRFTPFNELSEKDKSQWESTYQFHLKCANGRPPNFASTEECYISAMNAKEAFDRLSEIGRETSRVGGFQSGAERAANYIDNNL